MFPVLLVKSIPTTLSFLQTLDRRSLEKRLASYHFIKDNTRAKDVRSTIVSCIAKDFRCRIAYRTRALVDLSLGVSQFGGKTEVNKPNVSVVFL